MKNLLIKILNWNIPSADGIFQKLFKTNSINYNDLEKILDGNNFQSFKNNYGGIELKTYLYSNNDFDSIVLIKNILIEKYNFRLYSIRGLLYLITNNTIYLIFNEDFILLDIIKNDNYKDFLTKDLNLKKSCYQKYIFDLDSFKTMIKAYKIKTELSKKYKLIHIQKNTIIINDHIESTHFIYGDHNPSLYKLPTNCKTIIYQLEFYTNSNNELVEVKAISNNKNHPNIDYRHNKYCIGNFRFKQLNTPLIENVIDNIKIYNMISSYNIPKNLKKYIANTISNTEKIDINFL